MSRALLVDFFSLSLWLSQTTNHAGPITNIEKTKVQCRGEPQNQDKKLTSLNEWGDTLKPKASKLTGTSIQPDQCNQENEMAHPHPPDRD